jgi:hypothetical protein
MFEKVLTWKSGVVAKLILNFHSINKRRVF